MTTRERLNHIFNFEPIDRLPVVEWAPFWDLTLDRWREEGLPVMPIPETVRYFGSEYFKQFWFAHRTDDCPHPAFHGAPILKNPDDYSAFKRYLFPEDVVSRVREDALAIKSEYERGETPVWITLEGFFWFPRTLFGIEEHLVSFYDCPEVYHEICRDLVAFHLRVIEEFCSIMTPDFMTFAEDMSYNQGPMLSKPLFDEFLLPYYRMVIPELKKRGTKVFADTDGNLHDMIPWLIEAGFDGVLPLERQAGVDVSFIREHYPRFLMLGGFDKMCLKHGEQAIRAELERLLPVMRSGGYVPAMDHQTPPDCSLLNYKIYMRLLTEYCNKAAN